MREVDRVTMDEFGLGVLQMMENAGRSLAVHAVEMPSDGGGRAPGELYVADIGMPLAVYERLSIAVEPFFRGRYSVRVSRTG
jgi:hypothetical protein